MNWWGDPDWWRVMPMWRRVLLTVAWIVLIACLLAVFMVGLYTMILSA